MEWDWSYHDEDGNYVRDMEYGSDNWNRRGHVMGAKEAKEMRRLKKKTKLSEKQIREVHQYRVLLAEACRKDTGKVGKTAQRDNFSPHGVLLRAKKETGLGERHPLTEKRFKEIWDMYAPHWFRDNRGKHVYKRSRDNVYKQLTRKRQQ